MMQNIILLLIHMTIPVILPAVIGSIIMAGLIWKFGFIRTLGSFITAGQVAGIMSATGLSYLLERCGKSLFCDIFELLVPTLFVIATFIGTRMMLEIVGGEKSENRKKMLINSFVYFIFIGFWMIVFFFVYIYIGFYMILLSILPLAHLILIIALYFIDISKLERRIGLVLVIACIPLSINSFNYYVDISNWEVYYFEIYSAVLISLTIAWLWGWNSRDTNSPAVFVKKQNKQKPKNR